MTSIQFASYIRKKTKTNSTTLPDADIIALAVPIQEELAQATIEANEDLFGMDIYRNLVADQRNYAFDVDLMQIKSVRAKLNGTDWEVLNEYDNNTIRINTTESDIVNFFSDYKNSYDSGFFVFGKEILLLNNTAIIDVVGGLKMWAILYPTVISVLNGSDDMSKRPSSTKIGFPRQLHKLWAEKIVIEWKGSQEKPIPLTQQEKNWENSLKKAIKSIKGSNLDKSIIASVPYDDGSDY